jgi:hypothetical protein
VIEPTAGLRLAVFVGTGPRVEPVASLLDDPDFDGWAVCVNQASVSLVVDGVERWGPAVSFGALGVVTRQLLPARDRLGAGRPALVRAGVLDVPTARFLLFEPSGRRVRAAIATTGDPAVSTLFPDEAGADALYAHLDRWRDEMVAGADVVEVDRQGLLADLERAAADGSRAVALHGPGRI